MFEVKEIVSDDKPGFYKELLLQAQGLLSGEHDRIANAANLVALLHHALGDVIWTGFYFFVDGELVVGPFQGNPACVRIKLGEGVCGVAAQSRETQVVDDVHAFGGHIVCDANSNSEIVVPLVMNDSLVGVLDIDSSSFARFDNDDKQGVEAIADIYLQSLAK
jgi:GAF domain-containing protein